MKTIYTTYFNNLINKSISKEIKSNSTSNYMKGYKEDFKGKKLEELLVSLCNKKYKTKEETNLLKSLFDKKVLKAEVLSNKYKSDIVVYFVDNTKTYVSLKNTGNSMVGALEITTNSLNKFFKNKKFKESLEKYESERFSKTAFIKKYPKEADYFEKYIQSNLKLYLNFIISSTKEKLPPDKILFLDKKTNYLYISTIDEYIELLLLHGTKGTFNTYTSLTRTSGLYCNLKIKVQNPLRIKAFKNNDYTL